jgi:hypothetical protein
MSVTLPFLVTSIVSVCISSTNSGIMAHFFYRGLSKIRIGKRINWRLKEN